MKCKHCGSNILVKDGTVGGKQRWKCTKCHRTMREGDKRVKYSTQKKINTLRQLAEGKLSLNEIACTAGIPRSLVLYWKRHYADIMQKELNAITFPKHVKDIEKVDKACFKPLRDILLFNHAFGIIWTEKGARVFIMKN